MQMCKHMKLLSPLMPISPTGKYEAVVSQHTLVVEIKINLTPT